MKKPWILMGTVLIALVGFGMSLAASSAAAEKKPFGGDTCNALTAEDFAKWRGGCTIVSTLKPMPSECLYQLSGHSAGPVGVFLDDAKVFDINRGIYAPVTAVPGLGDEAYTGKAGSSHALAVKAKGIYFRIDVETSRYTLDELKQLAQDIIDKL
jgi:hypothetical protein